VLPEGHVESSAAVRGYGRGQGDRGEHGRYLEVKEVVRAPFRVGTGTWSLRRGSGQPCRVRTVPQGQERPSHHPLVHGLLVRHCHMSKIARVDRSLGIIKIKDMHVTNTTISIYFCATYHRAFRITQHESLQFQGHSSMWEKGPAVVEYVLPHRV
jgi:hypothetical protein